MPKPAAPKPTEMWAVYDVNGTVYHITETRRESLDAWVKATPGASWLECYRAGCRCRRVVVITKEQYDEQTR